MMKKYIVVVIYLYHTLYFQLNIFSMEKTKAIGYAPLIFRHVQTLISQKLPFAAKNGYLLGKREADTNG